MCVCVCSEGELREALFRSNEVTECRGLLPGQGVVRDVVPAEHFCCKCEGKSLQLLV